MRFPKILRRSKKQVALSPAPGHFSNDDPEQVIFDQGTRLRVEANHWKTFCFVLAIIAAGAVYTRQPPPSVVKAYGISSDAGGNPLVKQLAAYKPDDQAKRTAIKEDVEHWFTVEPVLTDDIRTSRLAKNINSVKGKMVGNARNQFAAWLSEDRPFEQITTNPKLVREPLVTNVSLLDDSTVVVELTTATRQSPADKPVEVRYALTLRYQIIPPSADDVVLSTNPYGLYYAFFTLQKTGA
ncbi:type IV secretion system protein (plasmid) [Burkholderia sp. FERM BP-3421]|uniref:type IV secretion system protein n=1 Tax=Burkholderia sp. FERM BP-3421 TaxID=1494466 RepID=UPI0023610331|nr:type IV secretion system protein [Burkholderia sp. FERM BP-3421]WDD90287.1 type IV secretion system protein [Burkholderia sp. FERM BP-3421]